MDFSPNPSPLTVGDHCESTSVSRTPRSFVLPPKTPLHYTIALWIAGALAVALTLNFCLGVFAVRELTRSIDLGYERQRVGKVATPEAEKESIGSGRRVVNGIIVDEANRNTIQPPPGFGRKME